MKKMLALGALLVGVVSLQAMQDGRLYGDGYTGQYPYSIGMPGAPETNDQISEQIAEINKLFYGGKAPKAILPYLTYGKKPTLQGPSYMVLQYYPNNGTQMSLWPSVRVGVDCAAGNILWDAQTGKFRCATEMRSSKARKFYTPARVTYGQ